MDLPTAMELDDPPESATFWRRALENFETDYGPHAGLQRLLFMLKRLNGKSPSAEKLCTSATGKALLCAESFFSGGGSASSSAQGVILRPDELVKNPFLQSALRETESCLKRFCSLYFWRSSISFRVASEIQGL